MFVYMVVDLGIMPLVTHRNVQQVVSICQPRTLPHGDEGYNYLCIERRWGAKGSC